MWLKLAIIIIDYNNLEGLKGTYESIIPVNSCIDF
jgi:hypothetical protein